MDINVKTRAEVSWAAGGRGHGTRAGLGIVMASNIHIIDFYVLIHMYIDNHLSQVHTNKLYETTTQKENLGEYRPLHEDSNISYSSLSVAAFLTGTPCTPQPGKLTNTKH